MGSCQTISVVSQQRGKLPRTGGFAPTAGMVSPKPCKPFLLNAVYVRMARKKESSKEIQVVQDVRGLDQRVMGPSIVHICLHAIIVHT